MKKSAIILRLLKYLTAHKGYIALALLLTLSSNLLALIGPELSGRAIDSISGINDVDFETVGKYTFLMIILYFLSAVLSFLLSVVMISLSRKVVYRMRRDVFNHLIDLPVGYFDSNQTGDLISRLSYDIDTINTSLSNDLIQICSGLITVIGCIIMMARISLPLMLVFFITVPTLIIFTKHRVIKVKPLFRARSAKLGEMNGYAEEMLSGQKTIKAYGKEDVMTRRFDRCNYEASEAYYKADYEGSVVGPSVNFINNLTLSLICMLGAILLMIYSGDNVPKILLPFSFTLGSLSSFILYSRRFVGPINEAANIVSDIQSATSAAERVFRLLDETPEPYNQSNMTEIPIKCDKLEMDDVSFSYVEGVRVLNDISFTLERGETLAIVGPTGSGKTSLVNLLMRFYDPDTGAIRINGVNTMDATLENTRSLFTMVLQETWLFGGTIAENIAYGNENASLDDIISAAKRARIHSFIESLPNGYDTVITDGGVNISKGQKQLITVARAMLIDSPVLILDEATSNVDSRTEANLQKALSEIMKDKSSIIIAHRLSTIKNADKIIVLRGGRICEYGNHDSLLEKKGIYYSLYNSQFEGV
ncbi:MAG: ABC transporter ATP-binding protein [Clostridia bacterium]|nr:ABC transporter ATP-binding protein [Clostridia bacterium]